MSDPQTSKTPGRRRRSRRNRKQASAADPLQPTNYESARSLLMSYGGFEGSENTGRRGYLYWPTLDTQRELDTYTRSELLRKSRWLRANTGLPNRICGGLADLIGYLTPLAMSGDEGWNELAEEHWQDRMGSPAVADTSGKFNVNQMQIEIDKAAFGDGDILPVFTKSKSNSLQLALYEAHQIRNPDDAGDEGSAWLDGVYLNKFGKHIGYGLIDPTRENGTQFIAAADSNYHGYFDAPGRNRPPTILKHGINHLHDISEILADTKLAIKVAAQIGMYLKTTSANATQHAGATALQTALRNEQATAPADQSQTTGSGATTQKKLQFEDIFTQAGLTTLPTGIDIDTIQDTRPHPNQMALLEYLVRDIAWGVGVAPEILWNIEKLRGANNRLVNADLQRWIGCRLLRKRAWMRKTWSVWCAAEIKSGRLPEPTSGHYWDVEWIPQASITADKGREGKLNIDLVQNNLRSLATHFGEEGLHWLRQLRQISKERRMLRDLKLTVTDILEIPAPAQN